MDLGLTGRPALVAAASRGLGKASALALASEGARVAICARGPEELERTRAEIADATGTDVIAIPADMSREEDVRRFVREGALALGGCQILVTNAGGPRPGTFDDLAEEDFRAAFDLNFFSALWMVREALPLLRDAGYGRIVAIASSSVKQPIPGLMLSNAVRAGLAGWAKTLAEEVAGDGITVNAVLPDSILTDRVIALARSAAESSGRSVDEELATRAAEVPVGRLGDPRELGDLVAFLCSERASFITGSFVMVDGGRYRGLT